MSISIEDNQNIHEDECSDCDEDHNRGDECGHDEDDDHDHGDECSHLHCDKTHEDSKCDISNCKDKTHNHSKDEEKERKTCSKCKYRLILEKFRFDRKKGYTKRCIKCLEYDKKNKKKNHCEHGKQKATCKECGGSGICEHGKRKLQCIICHPEKACQNCKYVLVKSSYRFHPYCFSCYCVLNPDADIPRKFMIKEHHLRNELRDYFFDDELVFNKIIDDGCSLRRPDVRIELLTHSIIIENDEEQHKNTSCENKRTMELFAALGNRPLVMIRFNPDKYTKNGVKVKGCFKDNKASLSINKEEWNKRINELISEIHYHMDIIPDKSITIEYMYYDIIS